LQGGLPQIADRVVWGGAQVGGMPLSFSMEMPLCMGVCGCVMKIKIRFFRFYFALRPTCIIFGA